MSDLINEKTIIAQCTPKGAGALALIRLSGPLSIVIANNIGKISSEINILDVPSHTVHFGYINDSNDKIIDQVMFIIMRSPKTFTGENIVEITCHNNPFIVEQIIIRAIEKGARLAQPGEFAKQAFLNGKIDLLQAEAINELINAHTQQALKKSLSQIKGSFSNWITEIEKKLIKSLALSEASFEFIDDEMEFGNQILEEVEAVLNEITKNKQVFNNQQQIKEGIRIAIIGSVNAGKSSLFNALIKKDRAIISNIEGTTRDSIESGVYNENHYMTIIDTAGLRQTNNVIEQEGIKRSMQEANKADIILLVFDGSKDLSTEENAIYSKIIDLFSLKIIPIINKIDLEKINSNNLSKCLSKFNEVISVSALKNLNIDIIENKINDKINYLLKNCNSIFLLNQRQFKLLSSLENKLTEIKSMLLKPIDYEILSIHLNEALQNIGELSGKTISEMAMDAVFKEFCVGK